MAAGAVLWLALAVFNESRSEPVRGQELVALSVLNRTRLQCYPSSVKRVVLQRNQFSWVQRGGYLTEADARRVDPESWDESVRVAKRVYSQFNSEYDTQATVTHFHNTRVHPKWASKGHAKERVGHHVFMTISC